METKDIHSHGEPVCLRIADTLRRAAESIYKLPASLPPTETADLFEYWSKWSDRMDAIIVARGFSSDEPLQRTAILEWRQEFGAMDTAKDAPPFKQIEHWYFLDPFLLTDHQFGNLVIWEMWTLCTWIRKASVLTKINQFVNDVVAVNDSTRLFAETMARDFVLECVSNCSIARLIETLKTRMESLSIKDVDSLRVHSLLCLGFRFYQTKTVEQKSSSSNGSSNSNQSSSNLNDTPNISSNIVTPPFSSGFELGSGIANLYAVITRVPDRLTIDTDQPDHSGIRECKPPSIDHVFILHALPNLKAAAKAVDNVPSTVRDLFMFTRELLLKQDRESMEYVNPWLEISRQLPAEYTTVRLATEGELSECKERFKSHWTTSFRAAVKKIVHLTGLLELGLKAESAAISSLSSTLTVKQQELLAAIVRAQESAHLPTRPVTGGFEDFKFNPIISGTVKLACLDVFKQNVACFCDVDPDHKGPAFLAHSNTDETSSQTNNRDREELGDMLMYTLIDMKRLITTTVDQSLCAFVAQLRSVAVDVFTEETRALLMAVGNANAIIRQHNSQLYAESTYTDTARNLLSESLSVILSFNYETTQEFAAAWFSIWQDFVSGANAANSPDFVMARLDSSKFPLDRLLLTHVPAMEYVALPTANASSRCTQEMLDLVWLQVEKGMMMASSVVDSSGPTFRTAKVFEFLLAFFAQLHHNCTS